MRDRQHPKRTAAAAFAVVAALTAGTVHAGEDGTEVSTDPLAFQAANADYPSARQAASSLRHAYSLSPGLKVGELTSCIDRSSNVKGRADLCRIVYGYEQVGDNRDWIIDGPPYAADTIANTNIIAAKGSQDSNARTTLVTATGKVFEGCYGFIWNGNYRCDFRTARHVVLHTSNPGGWSFALRKLWYWGNYVGNALGCAGGFVGIWYGGVISLPFLTDCVDGPL